MNTDRRHELSKGLGALLGLGLLVGGVPALLVAIGPPVPDMPPGLDDVEHLLSRPLTDSTVLAGLGWAAWMLWGLLTAAVIAEVVAYARRRPGPAQRSAGSHGFRVPGLQGLAGTLVLTATLLIPPRQPATIGRAATPIVAMALPPSPPPAEPPPNGGTLTPQDEGTNYERYVVRRFDSPWRIAERRLGDGRRWWEILDERRRPLGESQSRVVIFPGQILLLPAQAPAERATATPGASHTVEPGESLSSIARQQLGNPDRWPEIWQANRGRPQPDGRALRNPNLIRPGWNLDIPATNAAPAPATAESPPSPPAPDPASPPPTVEVPHDSPPAASPAPPAVEAPTPTAPAPLVTERIPAGTTPQEPAVPPTTNLPPTTSPRPPPGPQRSNPLASDGTTPAPTIPPENGRWTGPVIGLGGLLAAGAAVTLRRARRRQLQRRPAGASLPAPPPQVTTSEVKVERVAEDEPADLLLAALGSLAAAHAGPPLQDPPDIMCLAAHADHIEAMLAMPHPTPCPGWSASTPYLWSTQSPIDELQALADGRTGCWPALVTVGALADAPVLLDLEQATVLSVEGPDALVEGFLRSVALQLATAPWATGVQVITSGVPPLPGATEMKPDQVAEELRSVVAAAEEETTWTVRLAGGDPWPATVAIVKGQAPEDAVALSSTCSEPGKGAAVVAQGPVPGAIWRLHITDADVMLDPLGLLLDPPATGAVADVTEALATRTQEPPPEPVVASEGDSGVLHVQDGPEDEPTGPEQVPLLDVAPPSSRPYVKVLGPRPTVEGWALDPASTTAEEMVVFLALQDRPVSAETLRELVIPNAIRDNDRAVVKEAASRVRRCLGTDADGRPNLPPGRAGYRLGPGIGTDFGDFKRRVAEADTAPEDKVDRLLAEALELVEGEPFSVCPPRTYDWATIRPEAAPAIIQAVVDAAHRLTQRRLAGGDTDGARWAARRGLLAAPMAEVLWCDLATVAEAAGDDAELALIHEQALAACDGDLAPETADHIAAAADRRRRARQLKSQANGGGRSPIT